LHGFACDIGVLYRRLSEAAKSSEDLPRILDPTSDQRSIQGVKFYTMYRLGIGTYPPPMDSTGGLYAERPDLRLVDRDGTPLPRLSDAFGEVRQRMLDIIADTVDDNVDGVDLCFKTWVDEKLIDEYFTASIHTAYLHANGILQVLYSGPDVKNYRETAVAAQQALAGWREDKTDANRQAAQGAFNTTTKYISSVAGEFGLQARISLLNGGLKELNKE